MCPYTVNVCPVLYGKGVFLTDVEIGIVCRICSLGKSLLRFQRTMVNTKKQVHLIQVPF